MYHINNITVMVKKKKEIITFEKNKKLYRYISTQ